MSFNKISICVTGKGCISFKGTVMQIEKVQINDRLRISKVS